MLVLYGTVAVLPDTARRDSTDELDHIDVHQFPVLDSGIWQFMFMLRFVINWNAGSASCKGEPKVRERERERESFYMLPLTPNSISQLQY
jgi:hypothetical protein